MKRFVRLAEAVVARHGRCRILDLGGDPSYWEALRRLWNHLPINLTLVNIAHPPDALDGYHVVEGDARSLPEFADDAFDLVHSNSVIEHVGSWADQHRMAREVARLAPSFFVQTPNYWFPLELHTRVPAFHWLPHPWRRALVMRHSLGFYERAATIADAEDVLADVRLLDHAAMQELFPNATIGRERWGCWTKSLIAVRDRTGAGTAEAA